MKYTVITTTRFERAVRLCNKRGLPIDKLTKAIDLLRETGSLPSKYKPHKLSGFKGNRTWECHIEPNWLLVWEQNDMRLTLLMLDTGTHADLFR